MGDWHTKTVPITYLITWVAANATHTNYAIFADQNKTDAITI